MSDGASQSTATANAGDARFDRTAGAQRWGEGGPERAKSRSLKPLLSLAPYMARQRTTAILAIVFLFVAAALVTVTAITAPRCHLLFPVSCPRRQLHLYLPRFSIWHKA